MPGRAHIFDLDRESFRSEVASWGWPAYRADQALQWLYRQHVADPDEMTNLSRADRACLRNQLRLLDGTIVGTQHATDGVRKLLVQWPPGDRDAETQSLLDDYQHVREVAERFPDDPLSPEARTVLLRAMSDRRRYWAEQFSLTILERTFGIKFLLLTAHRRPYSTLPVRTNPQIVKTTPISQPASGLLERK